MESSELCCAASGPASKGTATATATAAVRVIHRFHIVGPNSQAGRIT
jgi:hypothetical protein